MADIEIWSQRFNDYVLIVNHADPFFKKSDPNWLTEHLDSLVSPKICQAPFQMSTSVYSKEVYGK